MKTIEKIKVYYDPESRSLTFYENGKPKGGFVGNYAVKKMFQLLKDPNVEIIITDNDMYKSKLIKQMHAILAQKGLMDMKEEILMSYDVASSKDLTVEQLESIINRLNNADTKEDVRKERSVVLTLLQKLNIHGSKEEGWDHVNNFLLQPRIAGKILYRMNVKELKEAAVRIRMIIKKKEQSDADVDRLTREN